MAKPALRVRIAFGSQPIAGEPPAGTWVDITAYVRAVSMRSGRSHELDKLEAATATLTLENEDARFTPDNTAGPYYPNVLPMQQIEVAYQKADLSWSPRFRGFIESWSTVYGIRLGSTVTIQCVDLFRYFAFSDIVQTAFENFPEQKTGPRITAILDWIVSPFNESIENNGTLMELRSQVNQNALDYLQEVNDVDGGMLRARPDGVIEYISRATLEATSWYKDTQATLGDSAGEHRYSDVRFAMDESALYNKIKGKISSGAPETTAQDTASQNQYLVRPYDIGTTYQKTGADLQARLDDFLATHKRALNRAVTVGYELADAGLDAQALLALGFLYRVTVTRRPTSGDVITKDYRIQGTNEDIDPVNWRLVFDVSRVPDLKWILGTSTLGQTTYLA